MKALPNHHLSRLTLGLTIMEAGYKFDKAGTNKFMIYVAIQLLTHSI